MSAALLGEIPRPDLNNKGPHKQYVPERMYLDVAGRRCRNFQQHKQSSFQKRAGFSVSEVTHQPLIQSVHLGCRRVYALTLGLCQMSVCKPA